jgi:hypothetical protein
MIGAGVGTASALGLWQQLKSKTEQRSEKRRNQRHNRKGEPL